VIDKFAMNKAKPNKTPLVSHFKLSSKDCPITEEKIKMYDVLYVNLVGSLMLAMICTRTNIAYVGVLSRYMTNLKKNQWEAAKWVLQYLRDTNNYAIIYNKGSNILHGYVDTNYAGDHDKIRSTTSVPI
jgi:hypothetical protein